MLELSLDVNPEITFQDFWDELCRLYHYDPIAQNRREWQNVKLKLTNEGELSKRNFIVFRAEFLQARDRVSDWTESEEMELLKHEIPIEYGNQIH